MSKGAGSASPAGSTAKTNKNALGTVSALIGHGIPDDNAHSPNGKFCLADFYRGRAVMVEFLEELGGR